MTDFLTARREEGEQADQREQADQGEQAERTVIPALSARGLCFSPGGARILTDVDLDVRAGELVALIGPNGAGKSTVLAALAGDVRPDAGSIRVQGRDLRSIPVAELGRLRSVLVQQSSVAFSYTVHEVVSMGRLPWRVTDGVDDEAIVMEALHRTDMVSLLHRDVTTLSGGEQARVALARVLAQNCDTILLDEPTAALDIGHQEHVLELAAELAAAGAAVLIVLHDLNLAAAFANRVVVMNSGCVVADGEPARVLTSELLSAVYRHPIDVVRRPETGELMIWPVRKRRP